MDPPEIHPTACIETGAQIGQGCRVGPFVVVEGDTWIGADCEIAAHAVIKRYSTIGAQNRIGEGVVIGGLPQDLKFEDCASYVKIGDRNILREFVTVNRCTAPGGTTRIGNDCFLMISSHVAHECEVGNHVVMANSVALAGHVSVGDGAFLAGGSGVHQFSRVGTLAMVAGNAKVEKDVPPFCMADGVPARLRGLNLVGLRRAGVSREGLRTLKQAYRILISLDSLENRLSQLAELEGEEAQHLTDFVRSSQRGYCRARA